MLLQLPVWRQHSFHLVYGRLLIWRDIVSDYDALRRIADLCFFASHCFNGFEYAEGHIISLAAFHYGQQAAIGIFVGNALASDKSRPLAAEPDDAGGHFKWLSHAAYWLNDMGNGACFHHIFHQWRHNGAWAHGIDPDAALGIFQSRAFGHAQYGMFGGMVATRPGIPTRPPMEEQLTIE